MPRQQPAEPTELFPAEPVSRKRRSAPAPHDEAPRAGKPLRVKRRTDTVTLSFRVHTSMDELLTEACEVSGHGPKGVVEEAVHNYADALGIAAELPEDDPGFFEDMPHDFSGRLDRRADGTGENPDMVMVSVRLRPITRARAWHCCVITGQNSQTTLATLLNIYFHRIGVPQKRRGDVKGKSRRSG
ncbi:hypothetical protein [Spongiactinospora sp. TRM90649]|uniref:hypothetical protein n=1 Tax=Spongiactinospora sp. TRM90649 TaxID=3031114 RepID=UPI0023F86A56|nr:hypothetical protein [Spongiactinospora sp. TRM90649]MDF5756580.1 hypothetical protein [Spongiactinospora sp. TRM90649]